MSGSARMVAKAIAEQPSFRPLRERGWLRRAGTQFQDGHHAEHRSDPINVRTWKMRRRENRTWRFHVRQVNREVRMPTCGCSFCPWMEPPKTCQVTWLLQTLTCFATGEHSNWFCDAMSECHADERIDSSWPFVVVLLWFLFISGPFYDAGDGKSILGCTGEGEIW